MLCVLFAVLLCKFGVNTSEPCFSVLALPLVAVNQFTSQPHVYALLVLFGLLTLLTPALGLLLLCAPRYHL